MQPFVVATKCKALTKVTTATITNAVANRKRETQFLEEGESEREGW